MATPLDTLERWALSKDRVAELRSLTPGTADHFLFASLLAEHEGYPPHLEALTADWARANPDHALTKLFANRRLLASFRDGSSASDKQLLAKLAELLGATLQHERPWDAAAAAATADDDGAGRDDGAEPPPPSALDPSDVTTDAMLVRAVEAALASPAGQQLDATAGLAPSGFALDRPPVLRAILAAPSPAGLGGVHLVQALLRYPTLPSGADRVPLLARALASEYARTRGLAEQLLGKALPQLTLPQVQQLAALQPDVRHSPGWVAALLRRLAPRAGADFRTSPAQLSAYLDAVAAALEGLPVGANAVRHTVLFHQLQLARRRAVPHSLATPHAQALLAAFLALPRAPSHLNNAVEPPLFAGPQHEVRVRECAYVAPPSARFHSPWYALLSALALPPPTPREDEQLLRAGLLDTFAAGTAPPADATSPGALAPWCAHLNVSHLRALVAEARLTRGSDADREAAHAWAPHLAGGAAGLADLQSTSVLALHECSREYLPHDAPVALRALVKNPGPGVASVAVRVFEVHTTAWYAAKGVEVPSDIDLDGLVPHEELSLPLPPNLSPLRLLELELPLPSLSGPRRGVFVVELIAGGTSARALLRKGQLRVVERKSVGGHVLTVLDEANAPLPPGCGLEVSLGGRRFAPRPEPNDDAAAASTITIPFAASAASLPLVVTVSEPSGGDGWSFSTLLPDWRHEAEAYSLHAGFYVDREALVADNYAASLLVRPRLSLACAPDVPAPLATLADVCLTVTSVDATGATSQRVVRDFRLHADKESVLPFAVPPALRRLTFELACDVELIATGAKQRLTASHTVEVNGIDDESRTRDCHLTCSAGAGFRVHVLGKGGEPLAGKVVRLLLQHTLVREPHTATLCTDDAGCISLGHLPGFSRVTVHDDDAGTHRSFALPQDVTSFVSAVHTTTREAVQARVPFRLAPASSSPLEAAGAPGGSVPHTHVSLVEVRPAPCGRFPSPAAGGSGPVPVADHLHAASYNAEAGCLEVRGLPAGEYELQVKQPTPGAGGPAPTVTIRVLPGDEPPATTLRAGHLAHGSTLLQVRTGAGGAFATPLCVASARVRDSDRSLVVRVTGGAAASQRGEAACVGPDVRVHVLATRLVPLWDAAAALAALAPPPLATASFEPPRSRYMSGRQLGEEQRYILDRQALQAAGKVHPGNSLPRPQLLLNPWSVGTAASDVVQAKAGSNYESHHEAAGRVMKQSLRGGGMGHFNCIVNDDSDTASHVSLDFLSAPSVLRANLRPHAHTGELVLPLADLVAAGMAEEPLMAGDLFVTVVAVDTLGAASLALPVALSSPHSPPLPLARLVRDVTTSRPRLDPALHLLQQSRVSVLARPGDAVVVTATGTKVEVYPSLDRAFSLLAALSDDGDGAALSSEFGWLLQWPRLSYAEKCARYSKYACHEVNLLLFARDAPFFEAVIAPFLSCKRAKTFLDHWLLGHDCAPYAAAHTFPQLNAAESALLAAAAGSPAAAAAIAARLRDLATSEPLSRERREEIFEAALASSALDDKAHAAEESTATGSVKRLLKQSQSVVVRESAAAYPEGAFEVAESARRPESAQGRFGPAPQMMMRMAAPPPMAMAMPMGGMPPQMGAPMAAMAAVSQRSAPRNVSMMMAHDSMMMAHDSPEGAADSADLARRSQAREASSYRPLDKTEELAETHYWRVRLPRLSDDRQDLVPVSEYWADLAAHMAALQPAVAAATGPAARRAVLQGAFARAPAPFVSAHFAACTANLNESLLALATLGLPWEADDARPPQPPRVSLASAASSSLGGLTFTSGDAPVVLFHRDIAAVAGVGASAAGADADSVASLVAGGGPTVLVGQSYFDPDDRHEYVRGEQANKFLPVGAQLSPGRVYGCFVVLSNITQASLPLDALLCIPAGSLPVGGSRAVRTHSLSLDGYSTTHVEYLFYFPSPGRYEHYPVHVSSEGTLLAHAAPATLDVSERPARSATDSWEALAANGSADAVLAYLGTADSATTSIDLVLWRCCGKGGASFWRRLVALMRSRFWFDPTVWELALLHADAPTLRELLRRRLALSALAGEFVTETVPVFASALLTLRGEAGVGDAAEDAADAEPVLQLDSPDDGGAYEHLEYAPLVNARAHQLGATRRILNKAVARQYRTLLQVLCCKPAHAVSPADLLAVTYHLLLQDRVAEALVCFDTVAPPAGSVAAAVSRAGGGGAPSSSPSGGGNWSAMQYDYTAAYLDFFRFADWEDDALAQEAPSSGAAPAPGGAAAFAVARAVARAYAACAVPKWAARFAELSTQLQEAGLLAAPAAAASPGGEAEARSEGSSTAPLRAAAASVGSGVSPVEAGVAAELTREAALARAASRDPVLELALSRGHAGAAAGASSSMELTYANLATATVRFFRVDLELLFSTSPFTLVDGGGGGDSPQPLPVGAPADPLSRPRPAEHSLGQFSFVRPTATLQVALPGGGGSGIRSHSLALPPAVACCNVMVEVTGDGTSLRRVSPHFASSLRATFNEPLGRLRVTAAAGSGEAGGDSAAAAGGGARPLPRVYVKVYWRDSDAPDARASFLKDGYTDLRGVFDYAAISTDELGRARRLAVLVASPTHGSLVRLVAPPRT